MRIFDEDVFGCIGDDRLVSYIDSYGIGFLGKCSNVTFVKVVMYHASSGGRSSDTDDGSKC